MNAEQIVQCSVEGCERSASYKSACLCQKHYFRLRRNGSVHLLPKTPGKTRRLNAKGYVMIKEPGHPLAMCDGWVYEHRKVMFAQYGEDLPDCDLCGAPTNWSTCHVDHKDQTVDNNVISNLRPVCRGCNTSRTQRRTTPVYECMGMVLTVKQWSEQPGAMVGPHQINLRLKAGNSIEDAVFSANKTHPNGRRRTSATGQTHAG